MGLSEMIANWTGKNPQVAGFVSGVQGFISQNGGFEGLKAKFEKEGAGSIINSWISTGPNLPISQEQLQKVMGNDFVKNMAAKMGVDPATASKKLTEVLPKLIDNLTPDGKAPTNLDTKSLMSAASNLMDKTKH